MHVINNNPLLREELQKAGLISIQECTDEENTLFDAMVAANKALPSDVVPSETYLNKYSRITPCDISDSGELNMIVMLLLRHVQSIKNWVTYFGVLSVLSMILTIVLLLLKLR